MNLQQIKNDIDKVGLPSKVLEATGAIVDKALSLGYLSADEGDKLLAIIDVELEKERTKVKTAKEIVAAISEFENDIAEDIAAATQNIENSIEEFDKAITTTTA